MTNANTRRKIRRLGMKSTAELKAFVDLQVALGNHPLLQAVNDFMAPKKPLFNEEHSLVNKYRRVKRFLARTGSDPVSHRQWRKQERLMKRHEVWQQA